VFVWLYAAVFFPGVLKDLVVLEHEVARACLQGRFDALCFGRCVRYAEPFVVLCGKGESAGLVEIVLPRGLRSGLTDVVKNIGNRTNGLNIRVMLFVVEKSFAPEIELIDPLEEYMKMVVSVLVALSNDFKITDWSESFEMLSQCSR